jgi:hypothetical protein
MPRFPVTALIGLLSLLAAPLAAQHSHGGGGHSSSRSYSHSSGRGHSSARAPKASRPSEPSSKAYRGSRVPEILRGSSSSRDRHGRIKRSEEAKRDFEKQTGHPHGWPGHVVDHKVPLACGGADAPSNMQWQTTEEAKAKDKVERHGCSGGGRH